MRSPEQRMPDKEHAARTVHQSRFTDAKGRPKLLRVVVEENETELVAVTVYPASDIKRYWQT